MTTSKPSWLTEECPSWCKREHEEGDHGGDRCHQSEATYLAAIVAEEDTLPITASMTGMDLTVRRGRYVGDPTEWVAIEPATDGREPRLVLTADSAARLAVVLDLQLTATE